MQSTASNDARTEPVLITGGTGSFGQTMARYLLENGHREIRILSRDEEKQDAMRNRFNRDELRFYIGDVRDRLSVRKVMQNVRRVFHAAALKQVPSCEFFPIEAVRTNVLGSQNVIECAVEAGADSVVCLSTDKAVQPVNAMGMTKALMEKAAQSASRNLGAGETRICCVRYGNVMCSRGSVIPLFIRQIKSGDPITVTEPEMTRFMLSLPNAIELVNFAFDNGENGDVLVRKAPACTVLSLAEALKSIFDSENEIKIIGVRHGEKLYETLASAEELRRAEDMGEYYRIRFDNRDLNYAKYFTEGSDAAASFTDYNSHNTERLGMDALKDLLLGLPEIRSELRLDD